jgi:hypothetical protein
LYQKAWYIECDEDYTRSTSRAFLQAERAASFESTDNLNVRG